MTGRQGDEPFPFDFKHEAFPFVGELGGGIRCSCGWVECTKPSPNPKKRVGMGKVRKLYLEHWSQMHPDTRPHTPPATVEALQMFDTEAYTRPKEGHDERKQR